MIEAQRQLGELLLKKRKGKGFLTSILEDVNKERRGKQQHIIILNLNTEKEQMEISHKPVGDKTAEEYLWIGNADAAASPQWYFTSNKPDYILSQVITNILKLFPKGNKFYSKLKKVHEKFFYDLGEQKGMRKRQRYIMDLNKLQLMDKDISEIENEYEGNVKEVLGEVVIKLEDKIKEKTELNKSQMALWTLKIDDKKLVNNELYQKQIIEDKFESIFSDTTNKKICSLCQQKKKVTSETTKFDFKYYITDKIGFSSQISDNFINNFRLCRPCYQAVLAGENFIKKNANLRIGNFNTYLIPSAIYDPDETLIRESSPLWNDFQKALTDIDQIINEEDFLQRILEFTDKGNNYIMNLIFYEKNQQEFKILKYIKDIPPTRFSKLINLNKELALKIEGIFGDSSNWGIDFNTIYYMIPLKSSQGNPVEYRKLLTLYENILNDVPVKESFLIKQFVKMARVHFYEQYTSYNVNQTRDNLEAMRREIEKNNVFISFLERLGLLERRRGMQTEELMLDDDFKNYLDCFAFNEAKTSLFLLGYLVGEVSLAQDAVLNKINFQGMNLSKVKRLVSEIFEKLRQYEKLQYNRKVYAEMKRLFDSQLPEWSLSSQENVFYILSGYAYQVRRLYSRRKENEEETNNDQ